MQSLSNSPGLYLPESDELLELVLMRWSGGGVPGLEVSEEEEDEEVELAGCLARLLWGGGGTELDDESSDCVESRLCCSGRGGSGKEERC